MDIKFVKLRDGAKIPTQVPGSAGLDFYPCFDDEYLIIHGHETKLVPTGISMVLDPAFFMLLEERGSTGVKGIKRSAGVVDADYRGEIFVCIYNANDLPLCITKKENLDQITFYTDDTNILYSTEMICYSYSKAIAQGLILPCIEVSSKEITSEEFNTYVTLRGSGALGSTGK